ncbi:hypothetical protein RUM43_014324 [Polyplax serrata]|uniref:Uncharacterized protein n=1 Tax=Polyplax serrata TaxID=468196 RepID=A0AAN8P4C4_POLSC
MENPRPRGLENPKKRSASTFLTALAFLTRPGPSARNLPIWTWATFPTALTCDRCNVQFIGLKRRIVYDPSCRFHLGRYRVGRSSMTGTGGASSSSSSFSSGSAGVGAGGYGGTGGYGGSAGFGAGNFMFPTQFPFFQFPNAGGAPYHDFNALYQQFLSSLYAAQAHAAQNPSYAPIFQQQITSLIAQQQAAMAQIPFAFPGGSSNLGQAGGVGSYPGASQSSSTSFSTGGTGGTGAYPTGAGQGVGTTYNEGSPNSGTTYTSASVNYGPQGGYGQASAFPGGADGLGRKNFPHRVAEPLESSAAVQAEQVTSTARELPLRHPPLEPTTTAKLRSEQ